MLSLNFDHGPNAIQERFDRPNRIIRADHPNQVDEALRALDDAHHRGEWLAGFASYELGYTLEPRLQPLLPENRVFPLLMFGVYDGPKPQHSTDPNPDARLANFEPRWPEMRYQQGFDAVHQYICAGDSYQVNLTFPITATAHGTSQEIYDSLKARQPVNYGVRVEAEGLPSILSRSPELFFRIDESRKISTRPMKGTQPRGADPVEDAARAMFLKSDEKNQAENLMIVDLLRNDISRVCVDGSVHVPELFTVESYETVHQMVSLIEGQLKPDVTISQIFQALFPCGSITGAPKLRAMEIIAELETGAREIYCGSIGWIAPSGRSEFNVAIRTVIVDGDNARMNVGGGVVYDSTSRSEYEEAIWKSRFAR